MDLFKSIKKPLAERVRPESLEEFIGQEEITGKDSLVYKSIKAGNIPSIIFWGPPGTGKTTLAYLIAKKLEMPFYQLNAISSGVADLRKVIQEADQRGTSLLFIDEIHRFNKSQQDSLLKAVENGTIRLIGATTENPSFEVIPALISRCQVLVLKNHGKEELEKILEMAMNKDSWLKTKRIIIKEKEALFYLSGGDARKMLNLLEIAVDMTEGSEIVIDNDKIKKASGERVNRYDKGGEMHYDIISAFIKSVRGSDPDAAVYWLARMLKGGEDVKFIARRLMILAAEDIGLANPNALLIAQSCFEICRNIGMPEARIPLSEATIYLACSPKSNAAYLAINQAMAEVDQSGNLEVPLHLRNAPTSLMKELNYGGGYKYPHDYALNFVKQEYLPEEIKDKQFYEPGKNPKELELKKFLEQRWDI